MKDKKPPRPVKPVKAWAYLEDNGRIDVKRMCRTLDSYPSAIRNRVIRVLIRPAPKRVLHESVSPDVLSEYQVRDPDITVWVGLTTAKRIRVIVEEEL